MTLSNARIVSSLLLAMTLGLGCGGSKQSAPAASSSPEAGPDEAAAAATAVAAEGDGWDTFWPEFQAAVASEDVAKMTVHVQFGEAISEAEWADNHSIWINDEMKATIAKASASDWKENPDEPGVYPVVWSASEEDEDGNVYESAMFLYFQKFDGKFRLFRILAAG